MIYSKEKSFLFIHIPKTAGTSIRSVLEPYGGKPGICNYIARRTETFSHLNFVTGLTSKRTFDGHTTYRRASILIPAKELSSLYKFAFVRNPFDRLYSFYLHILAHPEHPWYSKISGYGSFCNMVQHLDDVNEPSQKSYITDDKGVIMTNYIGRFEHLHEDFKTICDNLNITFHLPKKNSRKHKSWKEVFTEENRKLAYDYYREDFEAFGYEPY